MQPDHSLAGILDGVRQGKPQAVQQLWERYYDRLVRLARKHLPEKMRRVSDEEDAALSAFHSFCEGAAQNRFPELAESDDLWKLLAIITRRKAKDHRNKQKAVKRGGGKVSGESVFQNTRDGSSAPGIDQKAVDRQPAPELALGMAETIERLSDNVLRHIACAKLEGYTNDEIARQLGVVVRTVERKLERIRSLWDREGLP